MGFSLEREARLWDDVRLEGCEERSGELLKVASDSRAVCGCDPCCPHRVAAWGDLQQSTYKRLIRAAEWAVRHPKHLAVLPHELEGALLPPPEGPHSVADEVSLRSPAPRC